ncbi:ribonuclease H-like domain-containing protein [Pisolithus marmoratus]|nr:ribonuclease H-like domain-containing protein [Pisolithus marmoratus]
MEWRVMWKAGAAERRTALVQLCDSRTILLIQISSMKRFPRKVLEVIECPNIVKTGANIKKDGEKLYRDFGIRARGLVELGALAAKADEKFRSMYNREVVSLAKMVSLYLGKTLVKNSARTSNWEVKLTTKMVDYAANDCHCAVMVYNKLVEKAVLEGKHLEMSTYSCDIDPCAIKLGVEPALERSRSTGSSVAVSPSFRDYCIPEPASPQYLRAYRMWYDRKMPLDSMCFELKAGGRTEPLKESTVISYVIGALQADALLPFDLRELRELVQTEAGSWQRHRTWIHERERRTLTL